jgi:predicted nuclease of restriction endonuclease-like RecB superfamily
MTPLTKMRISMALKLLPKSKRGKHFSKPKVKMICVGCGKSFELVPYLSKTQKYCSIHCNIVALGRKTTSPKASRGKNGIRIDIDSKINFYSTWEANVARVFNLLGIKWQYAPKIFDLGEHTYRPDFYLPGYDMFIEVKNFMGDYSKQRDYLFRKRYPDIKLGLILKKDYLHIKSNYKELIENWEK